MKLLSILLILFVVDLTTAQAQCITKQEFVEDLNYLQKNLEATHPNPYWRNTKPEFEQLKNELASQFKNQDCAWVYTSILKFLALTEDGHNDAYAPSSWINVNKVYPIKFSLFENRLFVIAANNEYESLLGAEVTHIGNTKAANAIKKIKEIVPGDNDFGKREVFEDYVRMPAIHYALGFTDQISSGAIRISKNGITDTIQLSDPGPRTKPIEVGPPKP